MRERNRDIMFTMKWYELYTVKPYAKVGLTIEGDGWGGKVCELIKGDKNDIDFFGTDLRYRKGIYKDR